MPPLARAARAADAMGVDVGLLGRIEVDHVRDVVDVEAARGDVGRDERPHLAGVEALERLLALGLTLVAVDRDGVDVVAAKLLDEPVGAGLRADEDEREPALSSSSRSRSTSVVDLVVGRHGDEAMVDLARRRLCRQLALEPGGEMRV